MKVQAIEHIMDQLDIEVFAVSKVGNLEDLQTVYEKREHLKALTGFEPESDLRCRPDEVLSGAQTVLSIAIPYQIKNRKTSGTPRGFITNMAWEFDYHRVLNDKLDVIKEALLQVHPDANFITAVDTGPINDRMTAYASGIGWIGRNQFIIDDRIGSGFYIGILIMDFDVEGAAEWRRDVKSKCGMCRKCQAACPANALTGEYDFHGQRCISALTQLKRRLTYDERLRIGRSLYGCDICQWACPHNNQVSRVSEDLRRNKENRIEPFTLLGLTNKSFKREFGHMGFAWRGLRILKRNALIVIGNDRRKEDFDPLAALFFELPKELMPYGLYAMMMIDSKRCMALDLDAEMKNEATEIFKWMSYKPRLFM